MAQSNNIKGREKWYPSMTNAKPQTFRFGFLLKRKREEKDILLQMQSLIMRDREWFMTLTILFFTYMFSPSTSTPTIHQGLYAHAQTH